IMRIIRNETPKPFSYKNLGSMATVGRHLAVVDLPFWKFQGAFAWYVWMFVHLMAILGVKNKVLIFINWLWNYVTYDQSLRLIIKPKVKKNDEELVS
nr:NAD(P)/FAD-dependent oxidoreductase [Spirosomataceae bacterium]